MVFSIYVIADMTINFLSLVCVQSVACISLTNVRELTVAAFDLVRQLLTVSPPFFFCPCHL